MSIEEKKAIVLRMFERPDSAASEESKFRIKEGSALTAETPWKLRFSQLFAPDYVEHGPRSDITVEELIKLMPTMTTAFPDLVYNVEDIIAEGDKVVAMLTIAASAAAQRKFSGAAQCGPVDKEYKIEVGDQPGHAYQIYGGKCSYTKGEIAGIRVKEEVFAGSYEINENTALGRFSSFMPMANPIESI